MDLRDVLLNHPLNRSDRVVKEMVKKLVRVDKDIEKIMEITVNELTKEKQVIEL